MESPSALPPDENRGTTVEIVSWVFCGIAALFVALRIYSRLFTARPFDWDDAVIILAAIINILTMSLNSVAIAHGTGRHIQYLTSDEIISCLYYLRIEVPSSILAYCLPKLSVVIFLVKLMGPLHQRSAWFLYSVIAVLFTLPLAFSEATDDYCGKLLLPSVKEVMNDDAITTVPDLEDESLAEEVAEWESTEPKEYKWQIIDPEAQILLRSCRRPADRTTTKSTPIRPGDNDGPDDTELTGIARFLQISQDAEDDEECPEGYCQDEEDNEGYNEEEHDEDAKQK
ncbi:hypothetical protein GGS26DRAFT_588389 [Hypomontagnella submonticulosa]|nr:hypothetical protein GGS26DRAFT_588389 [Hypomontagnella submonticulosa]